MIARVRGLLLQLLLQAVETFIEQELAREYPGVKFAVYYTNDPDLPAGRKVEVRGQLSLGL